MLRKLLKYEFQATRRTFGLSYLILLACSVLFGVFLNSKINGSIEPDQWNILTAILGFFFSAMIGIVAVMTIVIVDQRFDKNLLQSEGYLMNTLPVPPWKHVACKLIVGVVWGLASTVVILLSFLISGGITVSSSIPMDIIQMIWQELGDSLSSVAPTILRCIAILIISYAQFTLLIFAAQMIGHQSAKFKAVLGVGAFIGLTVVISIVKNYFEKVMAHFGAFGGAEQNIGELHIGELHIGELWNAYFTINTTITVTLAFSVLICALLFVLTSWLLKNRLNLE